MNNLTEQTATCNCHFHNLKGFDERKQEAEFQAATHCYRYDNFQTTDVTNLPTMSTTG